MRILKKVNNNLAVALDSAGREVIVMGRGIGFGAMPYELTDLSRIDRTYYDVDKKYYGLLREAPEEVFALVSGFVDSIKQDISGNLNPNLVFILTDHINFSVERSRKGMNIALPYSYELEYENPEITRMAQRLLESVNKKFAVELDRREITSITMHILNAREGKRRDEPDKISANIPKIIDDITGILESHFNFTIDRDTFNYFRFKNHIKFFVQRKQRKEEFSDNSEELYLSIKNSYPDIYEAVMIIDDYLYGVFGERCPHVELLYLMLHICQLHIDDKGE